MSNYSIWRGILDAANEKLPSSDPVGQFYEVRFTPDLTHLEVRIERNSRGGEGRWVEIDSAPILTALLNEVLAEDE